MVSDQPNVFFRSQISHERREGKKNHLWYTVLQSAFLRGLYLPEKSQLFRAVCQSLLGHVSRNWMTRVADFLLPVYLYLLSSFTWPQFLPGRLQKTSHKSRRMARERSEQTSDNDKVTRNFSLQTWKYLTMCFILCPMTNSKKSSGATETSVQCKGEALHSSNLQCGLVC